MNALYTMPEAEFQAYLTEMGLLSEEVAQIDEEAFLALVEARLPLGLRQAVQDGIAELQECVEEELGRYNEGDDDAVKRVALRFEDALASV